MACQAPSDDPGAQATPAQLLSWAESRIAADDLPAAIAGYRRVLLHDAEHVDALIGLARTYELQERTDSADRYRRRAYHLLYSRGQQFEEAGDSDNAQLAYRKAVDTAPTHPMARLRLGELFLQVGHLDSAITQFEAAAEADPAYSESLILLAQAYRQAQRFDDAKRAFEGAIEANINAMDAYLGLGALLVMQRDWAAAVSPFEKALLIDPRSAVARQGLEQARRALRGQP